MFPYFFSSRKMMFAALLTVLVIASLQPISASQSLLRAVPSDKLGDPNAVNEAAIPAANATLHLTFALKSTADQDAAAYVDSLSDPKSPNFHKWLTPDQFGAMFGATNDDINTVTKYLLSNNYSNVKVWKNRLFVSADVSRSSAEQLLGVKIKGYNRSAERVARGYSPTYYAADSEPKLNSQVAEVVTGVFGLSNIAQRKPTLVRPFATTTTTPTIPLYPGLVASQLSNVYNEAVLHSQGLYGGGITIGLFSPTTYSASDIETYFTDQGIPSPTINIINVNGGATDGDDEGEAVLDIETIIGQAPNVTLNVYEGPNDGSFDIFNRMSDDDPDIVSESYGTDETEVTTAYAASYETIRMAMAAEGISIFVASGDDSAYGSDGDETVSVDASSAYVTAVGGTDLVGLGETDTWNGETAWSYDDLESVTWFNLGDPEVGSNGGLSIYYSEPSWQVGPGVANTSSNGMRQVPDVAALAGSPNYDVFDDGVWQPVEGTSGACPLWASSVALIEQEIGARLGNIDPDLYEFGTSQPGVYHDITVGNNFYYECTPGWDFVTGWGSADFSLLAVQLYAANFQGNTTVSVPPSNSVHFFTPGLQMISFPYSYTTSAYTISNLLTGLVTPGGAASNIVAAWQPLENDYVTTPTPPTNIPQLGQGYWARFATTGGGLTTAGTTFSPLSYGIPIYPGWNMVADPYLDAESISNLQVEDSLGTQTFAAAAAAGQVSAYFYGFNGTAYVPHGTGDTLQPFDGYWLYSTGGGQLTFFSQ